VMESKCMVFRVWLAFVVVCCCGSVVAGVGGCVDNGGFGARCASELILACVGKLRKGGGKLSDGVVGRTVGVRCTSELKLVEFGRICAFPKGGTLSDSGVGRTVGVRCTSELKLVEFGQVCAFPKRGGVVG
jgi:hypothetical protein